MGTVNRKPYLSAALLNQSFLDECQDNLANQLELIVDIESPTGGMLHYSDRNKYVGETFYEARLNFPVIGRTIGEYLNPSIEFSQLQIELNNADGALNDFLPSGISFFSWIGKSISVKLGLRDVVSTYQEIFSGKITEEGGFQRSTKSITLIYRNEFSQLNSEIPKSVFKSSSFPFIEEENENTIVPIIYGDWTVNLETNGASIPAICVNGADPDVNGETSNTIPVEFVISEHALEFLDTSEVYLLQSEVFTKFDAGDIVGVVDNRAFQVLQKDTIPAGTTLVNAEAYAFKTGDKFFVKVKGKNLGSDEVDRNIVSQSKDIIINYVGADISLLDAASWNHFESKTSPAVSGIAGIRSRIWLREPQPGLNYVLSLLEQVRLEPFIDSAGKLALSSLHFDEFIASPSFSIKNWDIERDSFTPTLDDKLNFNRARGSFNFLPNRNENFLETGTYRNSAAITQIGKEISKRIVFPNLYIQSEVEGQLIEILKICSSYLEVINVNLTWRSLLQDIGNFVKLNVKIQGVQFSDVPCLIRDIGYDPKGIKIVAKLWSFQMVPFTGWNPAYAGIVGGDTATITLE